MSLPIIPSKLTLHIDKKERLLSYEMLKISCKHPPSKQDPFIDYCTGKTLKSILNLKFEALRKKLKIEEEEERFLLFVKWDALRQGIAKYLGIEGRGIDQDRCHILSIDSKKKGTGIELMLLPPQELPTLL